MPVAEQLPYALIMSVAAISCVVIAVRSYGARRKVIRARTFATLAIAGASWMEMTAFETLATSLFWKQVWWSLVSFAILNTLMALFFFSLQYSLRLKHVPRVILFTAVSITLAISALVFTNPFHHLMWTVVEQQGHFTQIYGDLFNLQLYYTYVLAFGSLVLLGRAYLLSSGVLRRQAELMLVGVFIPVLVGVAADILGWDPLPYLDEPALSVVFSVIFFGWALFRFNVFYLMPVASDLIIKNMQDGVLVADVEGLVIFSNPAAQGMLGKTAAQMNGQPLASVLTEWLPEAYQAWEGGKRDVQLVAGETQNQFFRLTISHISEHAGEPLGSLLIFYNISAQKNYENRLNELAISDPLTGCYNRRYFYEMTHLYFEQMGRSGKPLSILMIDLDHFKNINDTYGHVNGDRVLQKVAVACKSQVRASDIFARYGGEEFVLAMPETSLHEALIVAERLRKAIESVGKGAEEIPVTASMGVVDSGGDRNLTLDVLLNRADEAMYDSKRSGRNRVTSWKEAQN